MAADPLYPLYTVFVFISFILVLIPLPWHLQAWNVGTCSYMIWVAIACLNQFVNSIVWRDNAINWAPVWCDISSRIIVATSVAVPACSLTITRRLYMITRSQYVMSSKQEKRRELIIDLSICVAFPAFVMILYYFVQGHRFNIFEEVGCFPAVYNVTLAYPFIYMWPPMFGAISMVFSILTIRSFLKRRREMGNFLRSYSNLSSSRYFRLMALSMMDTILTIPLSIFIIWVNTTDSQVQPWLGLADAHFGFSRVDQIPSVLWRLDRWTVITMEMDRWFIVICAFIFFIFFGLAEESFRNYTKVYWSIMRAFGVLPKPKTSTLGSSMCPTPRLPTIATDRDIKVTVTYDREKHDSFISSSVGDLSTQVSVDSRLSLDDQKDRKSPIAISPSDSLPPSPSEYEIEAVSLPPCLYTARHQEITSLTVPIRPPRPASLGDIV